MGLFDGQIGGDGYASTAHVADLISAPVVLVLDISPGVAHRRRRSCTACTPSTRTCGSPG